MSPPTVADVDRITGLADPVVRNLQITQCYHELASAMAGLTGSSANWCTFATWASKQAGQSIRQEDLVRTFERRSANSAQRIHFIAALFRAYHERQALFDPPCMAEQVTALKARHRPEDRL